MANRKRWLPDFQLDFRSRVPAYKQIMRQVHRLAAAGTLRSGDRLPTVRELAVQLGVNFNTVARAYRLLHTDHLVSAQRGRGTFMQDPRRAPRSHRITLQALTAQYVAEARRHNFRDAQIAAMVAARLKSLGAGPGAGDNHG